MKVQIKANRYVRISHLDSLSLVLVEVTLLLYLPMQERILTSIQWVRTWPSSAVVNPKENGHSRLHFSFLSRRFINPVFYRKRGFSITLEGKVALQIPRKGL